MNTCCVRINAIQRMKFEKKKSKRISFDVYCGLMDLQRKIKNHTENEEKEKVVEAA